MVIAAVCKTSDTSIYWQARTISSWCCLDIQFIRYFDSYWIVEIKRTALWGRKKDFYVLYARYRIINHSKALTSQRNFTAASHRRIVPLLQVKPSKFTSKVCIASAKPFFRFSYHGWHNQLLQYHLWFEMGFLWQMLTLRTEYGLEAWLLIMYWIIELCVTERGRERDWMNVWERVDKRYLWTSAMTAFLAFLIATVDVWISKSSTRSCIPQNNRLETWQPPEKASKHVLSYFEHTQPINHRARTQR